MLKATLRFTRGYQNWFKN